MPAPKNNQTTNDRDMAGNLSTRGMTTRSVSLRGAKTFSAENRQVTATISTEAPARVYDWRSGEVIDEVLLMSGVQMPESRQVPMLDDHSRWGSNSVIGSARNIRTENGELVSDLVFSSAPEAAGPMLRVQEGHLTDVSIGYRVLKQERIPKDEKRMIQGREYTGPMRVATSWELLETSTTPIGADRFAKMRSEPEAAEVPGANVTESRQEEKEHMDKLKKLLEARGLKAGASDEEAIRFLETLDESTRTQIKNDAEKAVKEAIDAERKRTAEIDCLCTKHEMSADFRAAAIKDGQTLEQVRAAILEKLAEKPAPKSAPKNIAVGNEDRDSFRAAARDSILLRGGIERDETKLHPGARTLAGASALRLAEEALVRAGQPVHVGENPMMLLARAMSTSDFPLLLADAMNKSLVTGFGLAQETWNRWVGIISIPDFRNYYLNSIGELTAVEEVKEGDEFKYMTTSEKRESMKLKTWGGIVTITRQAILNDDLGAFTTIPSAEGRAINRKLGDLAYAVLTSNGNMADSVALFYSTHGNLGTPGDISATTYGEAERLMGAQKDVSALSVLNLVPEFFLAGRKKKGTAETFFQAIYANASNMQPNIYKDAIAPANRIYDARLDVTTDTTIDPWYLQAGRGTGVVMGFLNGVQTPYTEQKTGWERDVIEVKCRLDANAAAVDHRGLFKNAGH